jgi:hypothetical protein
LQEITEADKRRSGQSEQYRVRTPADRCERLRRTPAPEDPVSEAELTDDDADVSKHEVEAETEQARRTRNRDMRTTRYPLVRLASKDEWGNPFPLSSDSEDEDTSRTDVLELRNDQLGGADVSSSSETEKDLTSHKGTPRRSWLQKFPTRRGFGPGIISRRRERMDRPAELARALTTGGSNDTGSAR